MGNPYRSEGKEKERGKRGKRKASGKTESEMMEGTGKDGASWRGPGKGEGAAARTCGSRRKKYPGVGEDAGRGGRCTAADPPYFFGGFLEGGRPKN